MSVTGIEPMLMPDDHVVAVSALVVFHSNHLAVGSGHYGVALAVGRKVYSPVNVILSGKRIYILAEEHGNMANPPPYGPDAGDFREQGALGIQQRGYFLDRRGGGGEEF